MFTLTLRVVGAFPVLLLRANDLRWCVSVEHGASRCYDTTPSRRALSGEPFDAVGEGRTIEPRRHCFRQHPLGCGMVFPVGTARCGPSRAISSAGERFVHTEEVTGSIPVSPTTLAHFRGRTPRSGIRPFVIWTVVGPRDQTSRPVPDRHRAAPSCKLAPTTRRARACVLLVVIHKCGAVACSLCDIPLPASRGKAVQARGGAPQGRARTVNGGAWSGVQSCRHCQPW